MFIIQNVRLNQTDLHNGLTAPVISLFNSLSHCEFVSSRSSTSKTYDTRKLALDTTIQRNTLTVHNGQTTDIATTTHFTNGQRFVRKLSPNMLSRFVIIPRTCFIWYVLLWLMSTSDTRQLLTRVNFWHMSTSDTCQLLTYINFWHISTSDIYQLLIYGKFWHMSSDDMCYLLTFVRR